VETTGQRFRRILAAFEDLVAQEEMLLRAEDFAAVPPLQIRAAPLVEFLVDAASSADSSMKERITAVVRRRERSGALLAEQLARVRAELQTIRVSGQRIAQVAPAYRQALDTPATALLSAQG
jgi:hypothetical protein